MGDQSVNKGNVLLQQNNWQELYFYQKSEVLYQIAFAFCDKYIPLHGDRTRDQMIQAARSGKQNIVEGFYGNARPENFPNVNDYRNNVLAGMMKSFNYVNMFNHGIQEVKRLLAENGNPPAEWDVNLLTVFLVKIK